MRTYDFNKVSVIVGGNIITGFADGTGITVERDEDSWNLYVGADGEGTRAKSNNKAGKITLTLKKSSDSNRALSDLALADELSESGLVPVMIKDNSGNSLYVAEQAYITKPATVEFGREETEQEWVIQTDSLRMYSAGN